MTITIVNKGKVLARREALQAPAPPTPAAQKPPVIRIVWPRLLPDSLTGGKRPREADADGFERPQKRSRGIPPGESARQADAQASPPFNVSMQDCWITQANFRRLDLRGIQVLCALASILLVAHAWTNRPCLQYEDAQNNERLAPPLRNAGADPAWEEDCGEGAWFGGHERFERAWREANFNDYLQEALSFCEHKLPLLDSREARDALRHKFAHQASLILIQACKALGELVHAGRGQAGAAPCRLPQPTQEGVADLLHPARASVPARLAMQAFECGFPEVLNYCRVAAGHEGSSTDYFGTSPSFIARVLGLSKAQWEWQLFANAVFTLMGAKAKDPARETRSVDTGKLAEQARSMAKTFREKQVAYITQFLIDEEDDEESTVEVEAEEEAEAEPETELDNGRQFDLR